MFLRHVRAASLPPRLPASLPPCLANSATSIINPIIVILNASSYLPESLSRGTRPVCIDREAKTLPASSVTTQETSLDPLFNY
jgi:hypothetical protein